MAIGGLVKLSPQAGAEEELLRRIQDVAEDVRGEPGNLLTLIMRDPENSRDIFMLELFADQSAIEAHRKARHTVEKGPSVHALLDVPMQTQRFEVSDWPY